MDRMAYNNNYSSTTVLQMKIDRCESEMRRQQEWMRKTNTQAGRKIERLRKELEDLNRDDRLTEYNRGMRAESLQRKINKLIDWQEDVRVQATYNIELQEGNIESLNKELREAEKWAEQTSGAPH